MLMDCHICPILFPSDDAALMSVKIHQFYEFIDPYGYRFSQNRTVSCDDEFCAETPADLAGS